MDGSRIGCCFCRIALLRDACRGLSGGSRGHRFCVFLGGYLIGLTALLLGFAWYQEFKPKNDIDCEDDPSFWKTKGFLGIITILAAVLLTFPYYSEAFFPDTDSKEVVYVSEGQIHSITLDIDDMTCTGCEATVQHAAGTVAGVLKTDASYETGKAVIKYDQGETSREEIVAAINKNGFKVTGENQINAK